MICISIANLDFNACKETLKSVDMAELRLDLLNFSIEQVKEIFAVPARLIATHRPGGVSEDQRKALLIAAVEAGAAYVDIEIESDPTFRKDILAAARENNCRVIVSHHDYDGTPSSHKLNKLVRRCCYEGGDIAKIACQVNSEADAARILSLYDSKVAKNIIALGMGPKGRITRIAALVIVEKEAHKGIVIGKGGSRLKRIGSEARQQIEALIGRKVFLELWVKVVEGWTEKPAAVHELQSETTGSDGLQT